MASARFACGTAHSLQPLQLEAQDGVTVGVIVDAAQTEMAIIMAADLRACGGSYVHKLTGFLAPCCVEGSEDCESAAFDEQQVNPVADTVVAGAAAPTFTLVALTVMAVAVLQILLA